MNWENGVVVVVVAFADVGKREAAAADVGEPWAGVDGAVDSAVVAEGRCRRKTGLPGNVDARNVDRRRTGTADDIAVAVVVRADNRGRRIES